MKRLLFLIPMILFIVSCSKEDDVPFINLDPEIDLFYDYTLSSPDDIKIQLVIKANPYFSNDDIMEGDLEFSFLTKVSAINENNETAIVRDFYTFEGGYLQGYDELVTETIKIYDLSYHKENLEIGDLIVFKVFGEIDMYYKGEKKAFPFSEQFELREW